MTMTCAQTWAQDENMIIDEDFEEFDAPNSADERTNDEGWAMRSVTLASVENTTSYLKITKYQENGVHYNGFLKTPEFAYTGNVILSFNYLKPGTADAQLTVSIENGGYFENNSNNLSITSFDITMSKYTEKLKKYLYPVKIIGATNSTRVRFSIKNQVAAAIDDVKVIKLGEITLNENYDPAEAIAANATEEPIDIQTRRTLRAGIWNTLCLPFNVDMATLEGAIGTGRNIELMTYSSYSAGTMSFTAPEGNAVSAGTPFLIKFSGEDVVNPTFSTVTLSNESAKTIESNGVSFVGTYKPVDLSTNGTQLFITTANKLARPTVTGKRMSGLRAYITVPASFNPSKARLAISGNDATPVTAIACDSGSSLSDGSRSSLSDDNRRTAIYNLHGQRLKTASKGLFIIGGRLTAKP